MCRTFKTPDVTHIYVYMVNVGMYLKTSLQSQLIDKRTEIGASQTEIENLRMKLTARDEELEELKCQFTSLNNSLEVMVTFYVSFWYMLLL